MKKLYIASSVPGIWNIPNGEEPKIINLVFLAGGSNNFLKGPSFTRTFKGKCYLSRQALPGLSVSRTARCRTAVSAVVTFLLQSWEADKSILKWKRVVPPKNWQVSSHLTRSHQVARLACNASD
jgi:hypothetical protein